MSFGTLGVFENLSKKKIQNVAELNMAEITGTLHENICTFMAISS
jgi:hypothetical protein